MPSRRRPAVQPKPKPGTTFTLFPKLPVELRLKIYSEHLTTSTSRIVKICWNARKRAFVSRRPPPPLLHTCSESRHQALKMYQLHFASSPEFARVYFSFERDTLALCWDSLGSSPGRVGRKMSDEEMGKVRRLLVREDSLLAHAADGGRELERFTELRTLGVLCDPKNVAFGGEYGTRSMHQIAQELDGDEGDSGADGEEAAVRRLRAPRTESWPELVCLRDVDGDDLPRCSRHWWFDGWNHRSAVLQREKWPEVLAEALVLTSQHDPDDQAFIENLRGST
ncbi:hypothetical protein LZ554_008022 [Drepanopeziza brunnea f. sp. 'monogermtubi']|nr:hypothetical protein LZ554_008022 [Drepanopeziza brunnea f. sp. 'monogermtubi']